MKGRTTWTVFHAVQSVRHVKDVAGKLKYLGDNCIENFHLGRYMYIVGFKAENFVLHNFR